MQAPDPPPPPSPPPPLLSSPPLNVPGPPLGRPAGGRRQQLLHDLGGVNQLGGIGDVNVPSRPRPPSVCSAERLEPAWPSSASTTKRGLNANVPVTSAPRSEPPPPRPAPHYLHGNTRPIHRAPSAPPAGATPLAPLPTGFPSEPPARPSLRPPPPAAPYPPVDYPDICGKKGPPPTPPPSHPHAPHTTTPRSPPPPPPPPPPTLPNSSGPLPAFTGRPLLFPATPPCPSGPPSPTLHHRGAGIFRPRTPSLLSPHCPCSRGARPCHPLPPPLAPPHSRSREHGADRDLGRHGHVYPDARRAHGWNTPFGQLVQCRRCSDQQRTSGAERHRDPVARCAVQRIVGLRAGGQRHGFPGGVSSGRQWRSGAAGVYLVGERSPQ